MTEPDQRRPTPRWLLARATVGAVASLGANLLVLTVGSSLTSLPPPYRLGAPGPLLIPIAATFAATGWYRFVGRRYAVPGPVFVRMVALGFAVSLVPIAVATRMFDLDASGVAVLVGMHAAVAFALLAAFVPAMPPRR